MEPGAFDVFLSHNSADKPAVLEIAEALRGRGHKVWLDLWELVPGRPWQEALEEAIVTSRAAAVCFGPSGLGPWEEPEMRAFLSESVKRKVPIIPVVLPAALEKPELPMFLRDYTWVDLRPSLTEDGLDLLTWGITGKKPDTLHAPIISRRAPPSRRMGTVAADTFELAVEIERRGAVVHVRHHLRGGAVFDRDPLPWSEVQADWDSLRQRLDEAGERALTAWLKEAAQGKDTFLFRLLFGEERDWGPVFRALYGTDPRSPQPTPVMHPVRLRVVTADPDLAGFPWRLVALEGRLLVNHGWTFEVAREVAPARSVFVPAPASLVVFSPQGSGLFAEIAAACGEVWRRTDLGNHLLEVKTVPRLENALTGMRPHVLVLEGLGGTLPPADLPALFRRAGHVPDAIVVCGAGAPVPPALLASDVAFLAWPRLAGVGELDRGWLVPWLRRWLERGEDPLATFHAVAREKTMRESLPAATLAVRTAYRSWSTDLPAKAPGRWDPRNELDRFQVKAEVGRRLTHLVRQDGRRGMALVASAEPHHSLVSLSDQLRGDHEREADPARQPIEWRAVEFPDDRDPGRLPGLLDEAVHLYLGADDGERLPHLLRRRGPRGVPPGTRGVLWLNWGTFGKTEGCRRPLKPEELRTWVRFSGEVLARECPPDLRVVSYLAIETEKLDGLKSLLLKIQDEEPVCQAPEFSLTPLPHLLPVEAQDLREFLREPRYGCPPSLQGEIARRVYDKTKGRFDPTVELLEEAKRTSWYTLLDLLRREQGAAVDDPEEEL